MTAVHWKSTMEIDYSMGRRCTKKSRRRKGKTPPAHKAGTHQAKVVKDCRDAGGADVWLRGALDAHVAALGARPDRGAPGWKALRLHPHQMEHFPQSHLTRLKSREYQFADIDSLGASDVGAARLARRFFGWLLRSSIRHGRPSEEPSCSKSGTQFRLPVDFHSVSRFAWHPVYSHGMAAHQIHTQGFDMFGVPARVGIEGAARNPIPAHSVVFAVALGLTRGGEQHGEPDGKRFAGAAYLWQRRSNQPGARMKAGRGEIGGGGIATAAIRHDQGAAGHRPPGDVQLRLFRRAGSRPFRPICLHSRFFLPQTEIQGTLRHSGLVRSP